MALIAVAHALDRVRAPALALLARHPGARRVLRSRALRIESFAALGLVAAFVAALAAPVLMFLWAPLLLGVPHLVADLRYLALPRHSPAAWRARDLIIAALLVATLVSPTPALGGAAVLAAWALAPLPDLFPRRLLARAAVSVVLVGAWALAWRYPVAVSYGLVHAHNLVAVAIFSCVFGRGRARWLVPAALASMCALVLGGALDPLLPRGLGDTIGGYLLPSAALERWSPAVHARIAVVFVLCQSVHYTVWLRLIPEASRPRHGARSFRASLAALERDFGALLVLAFVGVAAWVLALGVRDPWLGRQAYLQLAGFHAYLELAFLARWLAR